MKHPLTLLIITFAAWTTVRAETGKAPFYEERFNAEPAGLLLRNGATLGEPGSGVSGLAEDRAYVGVPKNPGQSPGGPVATSAGPIAADALKAFTFCFWYRLDEQTPALQVPLDAAGVVILLHESRGLEIRVAGLGSDGKGQVFSPGHTGPLLEWHSPGKWIFAAFAWDAQTNTLQVYQGTPDQPTVLMREMRRPAPSGPVQSRTNLDRIPETIGNTCVKQDRPLAGRMDNVRLHDRVLTWLELERIRLADIVNVPVVPRYQAFPSRPGKTRAARR